jgi:hypothetical protein
LRARKEIPRPELQRHRRVRRAGQG